MIFQHKKIAVVMLLLVAATATMMAFTPFQNHYKNLKVLPATTTHDEMEKVMDGFKAALGVKCNYCHAPSKTQAGRMDPSSDENPKKDIARDMMRMTMELNQKYISTIPHADTVTVQQVTCYTCHRGHGKPEAAIASK
ncbi:MAG: c-type cytochrome [Bacteroidota bacterium]|nr:c-type cytochrome [Bacteroidota bacterium]